MMWILGLNVLTFALHKSSKTVVIKQIHVHQSEWTYRKGYVVEHDILPCDTTGKVTVRRQSNRTFFWPRNVLACKPVSSWPAFEACGIECIFLNSKKHSGKGESRLRWVFTIVTFSILFVPRVRSWSSRRAQHVQNVLDFGHGSILS